MRLAGAFELQNVSFTVQGPLIVVCKHPCCYCSVKTLINIYISKLFDEYTVLENVEIRHLFLDQLLIQNFGTSEICTLLLPRHKHFLFIMLV